MTNLAPVKQPKEEGLKKRIWRRVRSLSFLILAAFLVAAGFVGLHTYYPQKQITNFSNSEHTVAYPSYNSSFFFNIYLYHRVNFTFSMPSNDSVKYSLSIVSQYVPRDSFATDFSYITVVNGGNATNNTDVVGWATYYEFEFYRVNLSSNTGSQFNVTLTLSYSYGIVSYQPEWLTIVSISSIVSGVLVAGAYITVKSRKEDLGRVKTK